MSRCMTCEVGKPANRECEADGQSGRRKDPRCRQLSSLAFAWWRPYARMTVCGLRADIRDQAGAFSAEV